MAENSESDSKEKYTLKCQIFLCAFLGMILLFVCYFFGYNLLPSSPSYLLRQNPQEVMIISREQYMFSAFMKRFHKRYDTPEEHLRRLKNFKESLSRINNLSGKGAVYGITKFSDMTEEEFQSTMLMNAAFIRDISEDDYNRTCHGKKHIEAENKLDFNVEWDDLPLKVDWRNRNGRNMVGPVVDQGLCGSCYAHTVVGVMESMMMISNLTSRLQRLSIEELLDCSNYTARCKGGHPVKAIEFLCDFNLPIVPEEQYPLKNENQTCQLKGRPKSGVVLTRRTLNNDVTAKWLAWTLATHGPVVATVNSYSWKYYNSGVIRYNCAENDLHHVVQIVGYNREAEEPYFISKNSWGPDWGEDGYLKTYMSEDMHMCGIGTQIMTLDVAVV